MNMSRSGIAPISELMEFEFASVLEDEVATVDLTGTYRSTTKGSSWLRARSLTVMHSGDRFVASSEDEKTELGDRVNGKVIEYQWFSAPSKGRGRFTIESPGRLSGPYHGDSRGQGEWTLEKID